MFTGEPYIGHNELETCGKVYCCELQHERLVVVLPFVLVQ